MSGGVQTPLSPVLQESRTTPNKQHKRPFYNPKHQQQLKTKAVVDGENEKLAKKRPKIPLPNKFLLGGNINDPLNLNGLLNGPPGTSIKKPAQKTSPKLKSKFDVVDVILRPNIKDPLNLDGTYDNNRANLLFTNDPNSRKPRKHRRSTSRIDTELDNELADLPSDTKDEEEEEATNKNRFISKRKRAHSFSVNGTCYEKTTKITCTISDETLNKMETGENSIALNRSVSCIDSSLTSPVTHTKRVSIATTTTTNVTTNENTIENKAIDTVATTTLSSEQQQTTVASSTLPKFDKHGYKFRHGNYFQSAQRGEEDEDQRLVHFKAEWFKNKNVLDIGCNVGHVTIHVAKKFEPKKVVGVDIDPKLIFAARKNIPYCMDKLECEANKYPMSCELVYGSLMTQSSSLFPKNVYFIQGDYVPHSEYYLNEIKPEYDFILALSITKWIHLNNGDEGIKRFFKKIYLNLNTNGCLLLEPQSWTSYKKKSKLTKEIWENYNKIQFKPNEFTQFLLSKEIGFSACRTIAMPHHKSKEFRRPILLFTKLETKVENQTENEQQQQQQQQQ